MKNNLNFGFRRNDSASENQSDFEAAYVAVVEEKEENPERWKDLVPYREFSASEVKASDKTIKYIKENSFGTPIISDEKVNDIPINSASGQEAEAKMTWIATATKYTREDNLRLKDGKISHEKIAKRMVKIIEDKECELAISGDEKLNRKGLLNTDGIRTIHNTNKLSAMTPAEIFEFLINCMSEFHLDSPAQKFNLKTVAIHPDILKRLTGLFNGKDGSGQTILDLVKKNFPNQEKTDIEVLYEAYDKTLDVPAILFLDDEEEYYYIGGVVPEHTSEWKEGDEDIKALEKKNTEVIALQPHAIMSITFEKE